MSETPAKYQTGKRQNRELFSFLFLPKDLHWNISVVIEKFFLKTTPINCTYLLAVLFQVERNWQYNTFPPLWCVSYLQQPHTGVSISSLLISDYGQSTLNFMKFETLPPASFVAGKVLHAFLGSSYSAIVKNTTNKLLIWVNVHVWLDKEISVWSEIYTRSTGQTNTNIPCLPVTCSSAFFVGDRQNQQFHSSRTNKITAIK